MKDSLDFFPRLYYSMNQKQNLPDFVNETIRTEVTVLILTVTLNTSIDKLYLMKSVRPETVMRVKEVHNTAGGKGLNVSRVAAKLGEPVTAMGFTGGFNGANEFILF